MTASRRLGPRLPPFPFPDDRPNPLEAPLQLRAVADLLQVMPRIAQLMKNDLGFFVHLPSIPGFAKHFGRTIEYIFNFFFLKPPLTSPYSPFRTRYAVKLDYVGLKKPNSPMQIRELIVHHQDLTNRSRRASIGTKGTYYRRTCERQELS